MVAVSNDVAFTSVPSHPDVGEENPALSYYFRGLSGIIQITVTYARLAGWGGSGGEGRLAPGRRVAGGGVRGHGPPLPLAYKAAPQSSILRTENELFSLWTAADSIGLEAILLFLRRSVSPERLPYGQI